MVTSAIQEEVVLHDEDKWVGQNKDNHVRIRGWAMKTGSAQQNMKDTNFQFSTFNYNCQHPHSKQIFWPCTSSSWVLWGWDWLTLKSGVWKTQPPLWDLDAKQILTLVKIFGWVVQSHKTQTEFLLFYKPRQFLTQMNTLTMVQFRTEHKCVLSFPVFLLALTFAGEVWCKAVYLALLPPHSISCDGSTHHDGLSKEWQDVTSLNYTSSLTPWVLSAVGQRQRALPHLIKCQCC